VPVTRKIIIFILRRLAPCSFRKLLGIAFVVMMVLPMAFMTFITSQWYEQVMKKVVFERNMYWAEHLATNIDKVFADKIKTLELLATSQDIKSMDKKKQTPLLEDLVNQYPEVQIAIVINTDGKQVARSDGQPPDTSINYANSPYYRNTMNTGTYAISDVLPAQNTGKLGIVIAEPIKTSDGILRGILLINIDLGSLTTRLNQTKIGDAGYVYVVNQEGTILIHLDPSLVTTATDASHLAPVKAAAKSESVTMEYEHNDQQKLAGYSYVPTTKWRVIVQQPIVDAMFDITKTRTTGVVAMILAGVVAVLLGIALADTMSKPLMKISAATNRLAQGDMRITLDIFALSEIGRLAANFNNMAAQIRKRDAELRESEQQYRSLVNNVSIGIYRRGSNSDKPLLQVNPALAKILGYKSVDDLISNSLRQLYQQHDVSIKQKEINGVITSIEIALKKKDGTPIWCSITDTGQYDETGEVKWFDGVVEDITERKQAEKALRHSHEELEKRVEERTHELVMLNKELEKLSLSDGLTGIANRRYFDDILALEWQRANRQNLKLGLIMLDIDYFKVFNDTYGHLAGDECLKLVAAVLKPLTKRPYDLAARFGGEEFAIILPCTNEQGVFSVGERLRLNVERLAIKHEKSLVSNFVTISVGGAALIPDLGKDPQVLIGAADKALYRAKQQGRNQTIMADSD